MSTMSICVLMITAILHIFQPVDAGCAIPYTQMRWSNARVPYVIDNSLASYTSLIQSAFKHIEERTCVRFEPRSSQRNYIKIFAGQGCYSNIGMIGGQQPVSLGSGCMFMGTILQQFGAVLGFFRELNRSDRDNYLTILESNIQPGFGELFVKLKPHENLLLTPFDYESVMLYGETEFSKDGRSKTMVAKDGRKLVETYDKTGLSAGDVSGIKKMYGC